MSEGVDQKIPTLGSGSNEVEVFEIPNLVDVEDADFSIVDLGYTVTPNTDNPQSDLIIDSVIDYLNRPLLTDKYIDHREERTPWINKQSKDAQSWLVRNRLGLNSVSRIYTTLDTYLWLADEEGQETGLSIDETTINQLNDILNTYRQYRNRTREYQVDAEDLSVYSGNPDGFKKVSVLADDPTQGYDKLSLDQKIDLANRLTTICVNFLQQNGFSVKKRLSQPSVSG